MTIVTARRSRPDSAGIRAGSSSGGRLSPGRERSSSALGRPRRVLHNRAIRVRGLPLLAKRQTGGRSRIVPTRRAPGLCQGTCQGLRRRAPDTALRACAGSQGATRLRQQLRPLRAIDKFFPAGDDAVAVHRALEEDAKRVSVVAIAGTSRALVVSERRSISSTPCPQQLAICRDNDSRKRNEPRIRIVRVAKQPRRVIRPLPFEVVHTVRVGTETAQGFVDSSPKSGPGKNLYDRPLARRPFGRRPT